MTDLTLPVVRTIDQMYNDIKTVDPNSAISLNYLKNIIRKYNIPSATSGNKKMFDETKVFSYIKQELSTEKCNTCENIKNKVRKQV